MTGRSPGIARELAETSPDPYVRARARDHLDGTTSRAELFRDRVVGREIAARYDRELAAARAEGFDPEQVRAAVSELRAQDDRRPPADGAEAAAWVGDELAALRDRLPARGRW